MSHPTARPEARFADLTAAMIEELGVTLGSGKRGFGSATLQVDGRIFAMLVGGRLVVKLPRPRVDALVAAGAGERFDPGHGRVMKEWLVAGDALDDRWRDIADEARAFVGGTR